MVIIKRILEWFLGAGYGILESAYGIRDLKYIIKLKITDENKRYYSRMIPGVENYDINKFDLNEVNTKIDNYLGEYYEYVKPKRYEMNIVLEGFSKEIKRKICVLSGKGHGIIDDCGGIYQLYKIFEGENTDWGEYDIEDFDLEKVNRIIDRYL